MGQFHLAIRDYDKALRLDPKFVLGYLIRGLALNELDQHMQAVENYDQAINLSPTSRTPSSDARWPTPLSAMTAEVQQDTDRAVELGANRELTEARLTAITEQR